MTVEAPVLKEKIVGIYPELDKNDLDLTVKYDEDKACWAVMLQKDGKSLTTYLEQDDAEGCIEGKECIHLGHQISEFIETYCRRRGAC